MKINKLKNAACTLVYILAGILTEAQTVPGASSLYRPRFHFTPKANWMNDPNGMVYHNGVYHLFFQYYPGATVWGPMHWGHATSMNMIDWKEHDIALYPDSLGYIFSGSAVVDVNNSSGFGKNGKAPLVAIFTHHSIPGEKAGLNNFQNQSIAYSNDDGKTWTKYAGNPVLKNPGIRDFRDPKVMWYDAGKKWVMTLAAQDQATFYSSPDLKNWVKESDFGKTIGAHGGVWECPDLFELDAGDKKLWVLLISINPGGPNGGSATQYFIGNFDGKNFTPADTITRFMDYGTDNYAGVTFSNTGNRKVLIGWMSNWQYALTVPTTPWRSAMTLPRDLALKKAGNKMYLTSMPVKELKSRIINGSGLKNIRIKGNYDVISKVGKPGHFIMNLASEGADDFSIIMTGKIGEELVIGYNKESNQYYIDRSKSGKTGFDTGFAKKHLAPRLTTGPINLTLIADAASIELFADDGLSVMTDIFFPNRPLKKLTIRSKKGVILKSISYLK